MAPQPATDPPARARTPAFIGCSHGTDSISGRAAIRSILDDVARLRPHLEVREAFVDVQQPEVADVVADVPDAVVVPLLLSTGFHVRVDVAAAVAEGPARAGTPLGPDARLAAILADRLAETGLRDADSVVLAAAGSTDPGAARDVTEVAAGLSALLGRDVVIGYGAGASPRVPEAVADARARLRAGGRVVVAAYLLAPGYFYDRVLEAGADVVTAPLAPDVRLAEIALDRYESALTTAP